MGLLGSPIGNNKGPPCHKCGLPVVYPDGFNLKGGKVIHIQHIREKDQSGVPFGKVRY